MDGSSLLFEKRHRTNSTNMSKHVLSSHMNIEIMQIIDDVWTFGTEVSFDVCVDSVEVALHLVIALERQIAFFTFYPPWIGLLPFLLLPHSEKIKRIFKSQRELEAKNSTTTVSSAAPDLCSLQSVPSSFAHQSMRTQIMLLADSLLESSFYSITRRFYPS